MIPEPWPYGLVSYEETERGVQRMRFDFGHGHGVASAQSLAAQAADKFIGSEKWKITYGPIAIRDPLLHVEIDIENMDIEVLSGP